MADVPRILEEQTEESQEPPSQGSPKTEIKKADEEIKRKYPGLTPKKGIVAQRKISTGGTQYFDSGEYAKQTSRLDKQKYVQSNPKPLLNPALANLQKKPPRAPINPAQTRKAVPSSLATSNVSKVEH